MGGTAERRHGRHTGKKEGVSSRPRLLCAGGVMLFQLAPTNPRVLCTSLPAVAEARVAGYGWGSGPRLNSQRKAVWPEAVGRQGGREARDPPETRPSSPETGWDTGENEGPENPHYFTAASVGTNNLSPGQIHKPRPPPELLPTCSSGPKAETCTCSGDQRAGSQEEWAPLDSHGVLGHRPQTVSPSLYSSPASLTGQGPKRSGSSTVTSSG